MWKIKIEDSLQTFGKKIFIYRELDDGSREFFDGRDICVVENGETINKYIRLDYDMFECLVNAIHSNYKPSEGKYTEGKLEATSKHLEDLRFLLKIK